MKTYILIQAEYPTDLGRLARDLVRLPGIRTADVVRGPYDVIAEADGIDARLLSRISTIRGVLRALPSPAIDTVLSQNLAP